MEKKSILISRSDFIVKSGFIIGAIPFTGMVYGIVRNAHNYQVRKELLFLANLPSAFDGITIAQISDIHTGSFYNQKAVMNGINLLMEQKPDMVFFTGDFVNNQSDEMIEYAPLFGKIKAPLGVYCVFGNHDYGDYYQWENPQQKEDNLLLLKKIISEMDWKLLQNSTYNLKVNNELLPIIGVDNWGKMQWSQKYGDLQLAYKRVENSSVKFLLSHDPSHWDAVVRKNFKDIDVTFSGHTHGFQFGIEFGNIKWSPSQYFYKQWAGMYKEENQYLYVNRGYGYIGYPGRVGILPEITIFTIKKGSYTLNLRGP